MSQQLKIYHFRQNNSGGSFDVDKKAGIGESVFIEAYNADQASDHAERIGLYFDGVDAGRDCDCCGDRWTRAWRDDPDGYCVFKDKAELQEYVNDRYASPGYLHSLDGTFIKVGKD